MSKSGFIFGTLIGVAAGVAATLKLTDTDPNKLKDAALEKFDDLRSATDDFDADAMKSKAGYSVDELRQRGMDLANRANSRFAATQEDLDEDIILDSRETTKYDKPTEVFMPHSEK